MIGEPSVLRFLKTTPGGIIFSFLYILYHNDRWWVKFRHFTKFGKFKKSFRGEKLKFDFLIRGEKLPGNGSSTLAI